MGPYNQFFKLHDDPFRLTPDPRYLFLSGKHREVLAHLRLGTIEAGGFVCITGDVGTGKTTVIRSFLDQVGADTAFAYIFNPPQSPLELLQTINSELALPAAETSRKVLVDTLNTFLLAQSQAGRRVLVVVDEAQALAPEVLEELRLLSNIETSTAKLLQIVLFGQPQLADLLHSADLAQLNQRITLRWHLGPLSSSETAAYIRHRLRVASGGMERPLFSGRALVRIHQYSGGVPRLINILCHRCLLAAYAEERPCATARTVRRVYDEIQSVPLFRPRAASLLRGRAFPWMMTGAALTAALGWILVRAGMIDPWPPIRHPPANPPLSLSEKTSAFTTTTPNPAPKTAGGRLAMMTAVQPAPREYTGAPDSGDEQHDLAPSFAAHHGTLSADAFADLLLAGTEADSTVAAVDEILTRWNEQPLEARENAVPLDLDIIAVRRNLRHLSIAGTVNMLRVVDLPAILELVLDDAEDRRYAVLAGVNEDRCVMVLDGRETPVERAFLDRYWLGQAHIVWRDFESLAPTIRKGEIGPRVRRLQQMLAQLDLFTGPITDVFDDETEAAVIEFQRTHRLFADAIVGQLTRIVLYGAMGDYSQPRLLSDAPITDGTGA